MDDLSKGRYRLLPITDQERALRDWRMREMMDAVLATSVAWAGEAEEQGVTR